VATIAAPETVAPACLACGSSTLRPACTIREFTFVRCRSCKTCFCRNPVQAERTAALYKDETYFQNPEFEKPKDGGYHGYKNYLDDRAHIFEKFAAVIERLEGISAPGRLLDVGAGPGFLLAVARQRGWEALGLDLNPWASRYAQRELDVEVRTETLDEAAFRPGEFDAVTMMDLLEHVPDPEALVARAASVVREGGVLAILTPDGGSPVSRLLGARWPEIQRAPEHLVLFSVRGLSRLVERHGFQVVSWHSVGKTSSVATLFADIAPALPASCRGLGRAVANSALGHWTFNVDPHTKFCLYARRLPDR
jgi:2-polyprenyl-3-methyl-5-hydroxy-6-metoxy-1,4-benzoquinol methylase